MCAVHCMVDQKHDDQHGACICWALQNLELLKYKQPILWSLFEAENILGNHWQMTF